MTFLEDLPVNSPGFYARKVRCLSNVELWIKRFKGVEGKQLICYQPQGGAVVCIEGDSYDISQVDNVIDGAYYIFQYRTQNTLGVPPNVWSDWQNFPHAAVAPFQRWGEVVQGGFSWARRLRLWITAPNLPNYPNPYLSSNDAALWLEGDSQIFEIQTLNNDYSALNKIYKIKIFKSGEQVHEFSSNNPISAWAETSSDKCIGGNWEKHSSWVLIPNVDDFSLIKSNNCLNFIFRRTWVSLPLTICKGDDCKTPLFKFVVRPIFPNRCNPKQCPPETVNSFECNGFLCCYDKCGNLIKSIKL